MRQNELGHRIVIIEEKRTQLKNGRVRIEIFMKMALLKNTLIDQAKSYKNYVRNMG